MYCVIYCNISAHSRSLASAGAVRETVYRRRPGLPSRRTHHLEQPAGQHDIYPVYVNLPSASENISVPGLVPWHYHRSALNYSSGEA